MSFMLGLKFAGMFTLNKAVAVATKQKFYIVFPISFSILFICLFIGELIGNLKLGSYLCIAFSVIATLYLLYKLSITNIILRWGARRCTSSSRTRRTSYSGIWTSFWTNPVLTQTGRLRGRNTLARANCATR